MGEEFEVHVWTGNEEEGYKWKTVYEGDDRAIALSVMEEYAKEGFGCIKLEWRPTN